MKYLNPFLCTDGYKTSHHLMYPKGTELVFSNFTPRSNKYAPDGIDKIISFGQQMVIRQIDELFTNNFFNRDKEEVMNEIKTEYDKYLMMDYDITHIEKLYDLGYLPIEVRSLKEGIEVPMKVPVLTIHNTHKDFYWLPNFLETLLSNLLWKPMTSATIAFHYKKLLTNYALSSDKDSVGFVDYQGHDFSMRGLDSLEASISSGLGHAISFLGSDSLPVIYGARKYYDEEGVVVNSVPASEHSVMCAGTKDDEIGTFRHLMNTYPKGILSVVSDTWNLWDVVTKYLPKLKDEILSRDGKLVIRPDSGDPVDIICGTIKSGKVSDVDDKIGSFYIGDDYYIDEGSTNNHRWEPNHKIYKSSDLEPDQVGVVELLWNIFGGTINDQGYKVLDPHIGVIYGDSITIDRAREICEQLMDKGFASTNVVFGIGSFTYQYNTRDTFGFAMKATYCKVNGEDREIFKNPVTDDGMKKSAKGLVKVVKNDSGELELLDQQSWNSIYHEDNELVPIYYNGFYRNITTLSDIRSSINKLVNDECIE